MLKTFVISLQLIFVMALLSVVYGFVTRGVFTPVYVFRANFLLGAVIIFVGIWVRLIPAFVKFDKLTDHTTFAERFIERHIEKQHKGNEFLFLGLLVVIITGLIQLVLALLLA